MFHDRNMKVPPSNVARTSCSPALKCMPTGFAGMSRGTAVIESSERHGTVTHIIVQAELLSPAPELEA